jgi:hypothetical protein
MTFFIGKQLLRLGRCESRDFDAQIAAATLCILQYNLLSAVFAFLNGISKATIQAVFLFAAVQDIL